MNRRTFLTTAALATTGLAGCSSTSTDSGDNKPGGQPTKTTAAKQSGGQRLAFGETFELPQVRLTLETPRATSRYTYTEDGEKQTAEAGEGKQWVVVPVRTVNTTDRTVRLPLTLNFKGVVNERVFHPGRNKSVPAKYIGGKVDSGESREGDVMFLTPADVSVDEFRIRYKEKRSSGSHEVWWQGSGQSD
ncbi:hypothetical protein SAMN04487948_11273 [Halogranum amylolyticum]|uniref:DUF4352 domain-containing protein n=1 Tax=Halogranum amylolyticum TaxID=660520 RepID=A0A1H8USG8_9EURY|nr:hypothetical protein [Halogranum amylolyticum]SEP05953.1 hypothetical protein SAMN04487948_11273 [Halogranum amylolyticum]